MSAGHEAAPGCPLTTAPALQENCPFLACGLLPKLKKPEVLMTGYLRQAQAVVCTQMGGVLLPHF